MSTQGITTRQITITPLMANEMLKRNTFNRPLNIRRAKLMSEAIKRGEWALNGDTIRFSQSGVLLDGQHRLTAIKMSGKAVDTIIVEGLPDHVFETIDVGGAARTTGHILAIKGEKNYTHLASLARMYFIWGKTGNPLHGNPECAPTTKQLIELIAAENLIISVEEMEKLNWCKRFMTPTICAFCLHVFKNHDASLTYQFFSSLNTGVSLYANSPILLLRERLQNSKLDKQQSLDKRYAIALVFKAFKLYRDGASVKTLRVRIDGDAPEKDLFAI